MFGTEQYATSLTTNITIDTRIQHTVNTRTSRLPYLKFRQQTTVPRLRFLLATRNRPTRERTYMYSSAIPETIQCSYYSTLSRCKRIFERIYSRGAVATAE